MLFVIIVSFLEGHFITMHIQFDDHFIQSRQSPLTMNFMDLDILDAEDMDNIT